MLQLILIGLLYVIGVWALLFLLYKITPYIDELIRKNTNISKIILSVILLIFILNLPIYLYIIFKIIIAYIFLVFAFNDDVGKTVFKDGKTSFWFNLWIGLAILYNPIYQFPLGKNLWVFVDVFTIIILIWSMTKEDSNSIQKNNNKNIIEQSNRISFDFKNSVYKIYADLDFSFYSIDLSKIKYNLVGDKDEMFDDSIEGIPTIFGVLDKEETGIKFIYDLDTFKFPIGKIYCEFWYKNKMSFSTKSVSTMEDLKLSEIRIYRIDKYEHKLVDWCLEDKLLELGLI